MTDSLSALPSIAAQDPAPAERTYASARMRRGTHQVLAEARANAGGSEREFSFPEMLASLNPLNHLPFVSSLMPAASQPGATGPISNMVFGALLGGPVGLVMSAVGAVFQEATGQGLVSGTIDAVRDYADAGNNEGSANRRAASRYQTYAQQEAQSIIDEAV